MSNEFYYDTTIKDGREVWQYKTHTSSVFWHGYFDTKEEAVQARTEHLRRLEEDTKRLKEKKLCEEAQHLNAVLRKAMELDPELWSRLLPSLINRDDSPIERRPL